jgi:thiol-disulfide isomerase/thioredoxin
VKRVLVAAAAVLLLAACTPESPASSSPSAGAVAETESRVDVDTPALRTLKARAGVEPCRAGTGSSQLPAVRLPCLGGGPGVDLTTLRGPLVINLFAQWCLPCREELPVFQSLHTKAKGKVRVLGVDYQDTKPEAALELVRATGVTYPLLADPAGDLAPSFRVRGLPGVVLVDEDGRVVDVEFRVFRSYAELRTLVQQRLGVAIPA